MKVAILTYQGASLFELGCAVELFALKRPEYEHWYDTEVVTFDQGLLSTTGALQLVAKSVQNLDEYDMLIIPSWPTNIDERACTALSLDTGTTVSAAASTCLSISLSIDLLITQLNKFYSDEKRIYSFCSGSFLLAQAGLLNARQATTHWQYASVFEQRFPHISFVADVLYIYEDNIGTSAGSACALDLGIEIIRHDFGHAIANEVARRLVLSAHRSGGQSQYSTAPILKQTGVFAKALDWAIQHIDQVISIDKLAAIALMSRRTFDRKFRENFNTTPGQWLIEQRLSLAKSILETQPMQIESVAQCAGFANATTLRHHFRKSFGITPLQYRKQFLAK
jgi:AraC family transcriptional activator FtrA